LFLLLLLMVEKSDREKSTTKINKEGREENKVGSAQPHQRNHDDLSDDVI